jgi:DNA-binding transcriptional ArsR family regulator
LSLPLLAKDRRYTTVAGGGATWRLRSFFLLHCYRQQQCNNEGHCKTTHHDRQFQDKKKFLRKIFATEKLHIHLQPISFLNNRTDNMRRDIFQAIADPTRRAIITLIASQAMTPNAIAEHFDITRQAVSKHLRILIECEVVKQEQKGREIYYRLEIDKMKEIDQWLEQFRAIWESRFNQLDKLLTQLKGKKKK